MTVILLRHGQSRGNARATIQGWLDEPLTEAGVAQAHVAAARLVGLPVRVVYASPLLRARTTAEVVARSLGVEVVDEPGMREHGFGEAQGLTWDEASQRWGMDATPGQDWAAGVPGAEPMAEFRRRVASAFDALLDRHEHDLAVCVTHGGAIAQVVGHILGLPGHTMPSIRIDNTSLTVMEGTSATASLRALNEACHLGADAGVSRAF